MTLIKSLTWVLVLVATVNSQKANILTKHNFTKNSNHHTFKNFGNGITIETTMPGTDMTGDPCLFTPDLTAQCMSDRSLDIDPYDTVKKSEYNKVKTCTGFTCPYQSMCGSAPLNPYTKPKNKGRTPYVVHGEPETYGEFPQYVRLAINGSILCGGVLITNRHVLTAAHCTYYKNVKQGPENYRVFLADHMRWSRDAYETSTGVSHICRSRRYVPGAATTKYDYSVLTLSRAVKFNDHIQPACLPYQPPRIGLSDKNSRCYVLGFGSLGYDRGNAPVLQKLRVKRTSCRKWLFRDDDRSRICFVNYRGRGDSCSGDSGGPVLCLINRTRWTVVGLVSYGSTECDGKQLVGWVAVYTRVRALLDYMRAECGI